MVGSSSTTDVLHYPVLAALRTNSLSLECPSLHKDVISLCLARLYSTVSLIHGLDLLRAWDKVCDTPPLGQVQGDLCSSCHHFADFGEPWWATAGAVPAVCSGAWLHETQTGTCRDKLANVFGLGPVDAAEGREWLSLGGDEVALAGAGPACGGQEAPTSSGT